ncbi:alpha/beta hydrolase family protein [Roseovarius sp. A-2]|uniref:alpha/beta hydrolase n=1 Tax=Roseovarius sp. A-2 TaxID=1570360 RepID=UPI0009B56248|nr:alpha/beta hydrolase [Roseovarius sp. A-2]GAW34661.1 alpha/beta hydrolase family protein [Roseovarius sp. A-2]
MELDDAYANVPYIPGGAQYPARWTVAAEAFRARLSAEGRAELGLPYGKGARQAFDLFHPKGTAQGLVIFVHGGYWLRFDRSYWSHLASGSLARGWAVAMPSYDLCPEVRIAEITRQISQAVTVVAGRVEGRIALVGHSAGGHLVARMAVPGVLPAEVAARLSHVLPISPVSDLRPLLQTSMNEHFRLDMTAAEAESPALMRPLPVPVTIWVGAEERPVFLDQARWLAEAWGAGQEITRGRHHFDVIEALERAESRMVVQLLG